LNNQRKWAFQSIPVIVVENWDPSNLDKLDKLLPDFLEIRLLPFDKDFGILEY
jgi:hypothetical protein